MIDPELLPMLALAPERELSEATLPALRRREGMPPLPPVVADEIVRRDIDADGVPLVTFTPPGAGPFACILHMHGGGMITGSAFILEFMLRPLARQTDAVVVSVEYRLAPEHPFPAAIDDCFAALLWVVANAAELQIDPSRLGVMGESAGGNLTAALALMARDRGGPALSFQVLTYPMLDDRTCATNIDAPLWTAANNRYAWAAYLGGATEVSPYAAPARAKDLSGLPPTYLMTGALDLFADECLDYARRLVAAGVPTEFHLYPSAFHAFDAWPAARVSEQARRDRLDALARFVR